MLRRGKNLIAVEIKSTDRIDTGECVKFERTAQKIHAQELFYVTQDPTPSRVGQVNCVSWRKFLNRVFVKAKAS